MGSTPRRPMSPESGRARSLASRVPRVTTLPVPSRPGRARKHEAAFGLLVHPWDLAEVVERYALAEKVHPRLTAEIVKRWPPFAACRPSGVRSAATGERISGVLAVVPLLPEQYTEQDDAAVVDKIVRACKVCARHGAGIVGLGGLNAEAGRGGRMVADTMRVAVTTGNSLTVAMAIEAVRQATVAMGIDARRATLAVLGATSPAGRASSILLAPQYARVLLVGRDRMGLSALRLEVRGGQATEVEVRTDVIHAVREADAIMVASPAVSGLLRPQDMRAGSVICDVLRPRRVASAVAGARPDVLAIDGGIVKVPGEFDLGVDLGFGPGRALASMAEPMILALEGRYEDYTLGKEVSVSRVSEIASLASKHGFELAGLRLAEGPMADARIAAIRDAAGR